MSPTVNMEVGGVMTGLPSRTTGLIKVSMTGAVVGVVSVKMTTNTGMEPKVPASGWRWLFLCPFGGDNCCLCRWDASIP